MWSRYDCPAQDTARIATEETTVGGTAIRPGDALLVLYGAANRDPERFANPDRLNIARWDHKRLAFASGPHLSLGAPLACLEMQIVLDTLLPRLRDPQLATEPVAWRPNVLLRGLETLPPSVHPGSVDRRGDIRVRG